MDEEISTASEHVYDVIIVGGGIEGSSTAYNLAVLAGNDDVLLIEQFGRGHVNGSSHGGSRIIRKSYHKRIYMEMMEKCYDMWAEIERLSNEQLYQKTGLIVFGPKGGGDCKERNVIDFIESYKGSGIVHEILTAEDVNNRYSNQLQVPDDYICIYEESGGILRASKAVNALQELFIKYGGHLVDGVRVIDVIPGDVVTLRTERGDYRGRNVVLTAGSWTNKLTETIGLTLPLKPVQIEVLYWEAKDPEAYHYSQFPCFINLSFDFYGSPIFEYDNVIKACTHEGVAIDPDAPPPHRDLTTSRTKDVMSTNLCRYFKNIIHNQPSSMETCIYTMTPDSDPIIDCHPQYSNIIIGAGFSGHGFKLGPVIGKIISDMISSLPITYDMSHFKIDRFL